MSEIVIAIDGFSGTGKSSTAKAVARALNYRYLDSGAMYRAVTLHFIREGIELSEKNDVIKAMDALTLNIKPSKEGIDVYLNDENVSIDIRSADVNAMVSQVAAISEVREKLVAKQQQIGKDKGIVMDGRDIGSVVFPEAELKIFMTAKPEIRARRRLKELQGAGLDPDPSDVLQNLLERDRIDSTRQDSPLIKMEDAIEIDTSDLTFEEQVDRIVDLAKKEIHED